MMDLGNDSDKMERYFADYPLRLYCVNEANSFDMLHTELRELFFAMKHRRDKEKLQELFTQNKRCSCLSPDTVEALSVILKIPNLWEKRKNYRNMTCEKEEYDMGQAWGGIAQEYYNEGIADGITQGISQGIEKGAFEKTRMIVQNMLKHGFPDKEICELTGCTAEFIRKLQ